AGLVERITCPGDRRSFHVELTEEGEEMLAQMWPVYARGIAEDFMPALGSNPYEVRETLEAIGRQCDAVEDGAVS
ncbi:MAG: Winged helix DNA-binding domain, partial [Solirubrobacterales bacterium]|nr:Winged helix DNA-binding domain [Solirubrobacterales bacterium]